MVQEELFTSIYNKIIAPHWKGELISFWKNDLDSIGDKVGVGVELRRPRDGDLEEPGLDLGDARGVSQFKNVRSGSAMPADFLGFLRRAFSKPSYDLERQMGG